MPVIPGTNIFDSCALQHFSSLLHNIKAHFLFIVSDFGIHGQNGQSPFILTHRVERDLVFVIRQQFSKAAYADGPAAGFGNGIFIGPADAEFGDIARPSFARGAALVAKTPHIVAFVAKKVGKAHHVNAIRPAAKIILVFITFHSARGAKVIVVIHYVMPQLSAAAAQPARPYIRSRVHQHPGAVQRGGVHKNDF